MKILMVNKFLKPKGGSETYIIKAGDYLQAQGHEVQYFGMDEDGRTLRNALDLYVENKDFHTGRWKKLFYPFSVIYSTDARKKMLQVLRAFNPDIVHLNNFNYQLTPSILYGIKSYEKECGRKLPVFYTAHDYQLLCPNHMMNVPLTGENCECCADGHYLECVKRKCIHSSLIRSVLGTMEAVIYQKLGTYRYIDCIICPSYFMENKMRKKDIFYGKTTTLHNFVEVVERKYTQKKEYVLYFGRFSKEKGIETLLRVCKELPYIPFVFAGAGPIDVAGENIRNVGFVSGRDLEQLICEAKFSIYPSEWYENCPFSVMESQLYQTPVLGARIGGIPELIQDGVNGLLFESGNPEDLKKKIRELWNSPELCERLSGNCMNTKYDTVSEYCDKLLELYQKIK